MLDLFAGSGALGLEARSRGAGAVTFVDTSAAAVAAIRDNLQRLGEGAEVHRIDALKYLERARRASRQYDLVFLDPPYRLAATLSPRLSDALPMVLAPAARVVAESDRHAPLELDPRIARRTPLRRHPDPHLPCPHLTTASPSVPAPTTRSRSATSTSSPGPRSMFDRVIVAVVNLPIRKGNTLFTAEERVAFVRNATAALGQRRRRAVRHPASSISPAQRGAKAIVKGLRAISDFEYELEMNQLNRRQAPDVESVYLMASAKYSFVRSSGVKELATFGGNIADMVPDEVAAALQERLGR